MNRPLPPGSGNVLKYDVCSFACADEMTRGKWKTASKQGRAFAITGSTPARVIVNITDKLKTERELVEAWEAAPEQEIRVNVLGLPSRAARDLYLDKVDQMEIGGG